MAEDNRFTILYEDDSLTVVIKKAGLAVQTRKIAEEDLESLLKKKVAGERKAGSEKIFLAPINRLDQPVEGLVIFAKTSRAAEALTAQLKAGKITKIYEAGIYGSFAESEKEGILKDRLYKDERANVSRVVRPGDRDYNKGKDAELHYQEVAPGKLRIRLITGRHHQIRVQLSHAGHPILGDFKYGTEASIEESKRQEIRRLMLTAAELHFTHPVTKQPMHFTSPE